MIAWIIAGLLGMATGLRVGWALVNQKSVVSGAMIVALGNLAVVAALNWPPLTVLVDTALGWPNVSIVLSQMALVASAAGSFVMITSVASTRRPAVIRRLAAIQYCVAALIAVVTLALFLADGRQPQMTTKEYLDYNLGVGGKVLEWLAPMLYVLLVLSVVSWLGMKLSNASRRGRALLVFTVGIAAILAAGMFFVGHAVGGKELVSVGTAASLLLCALAIVAAGALLPAVEDWVGARRELRLIEPLRRELGRRHPDIGIGIRPRGPLTFQVAERLSLISDALYLEGASAQRTAVANAAPPPRSVSTQAVLKPVELTPAAQARSIARWIKSGTASAFPGRSWLRQPADCSDRDWILLIAQQYRTLDAQSEQTSG